MIYCILIQRTLSDYSDEFVLDRAYKLMTLALKKKEQLVKVYTECLKKDLVNVEESEINITKISPMETNIWWNEYNYRIKVERINEII